MYQLSGLLPPRSRHKSPKTAQSFGSGVFARLGSVPPYGEPDIWTVLARAERDFEVFEVFEVEVVEVG